jgi:hypothetical protein
MSIHLICGDQYFNCRVSYWNNLRQEISKATNLYIVDYLQNFEHHIHDYDSEEYKKNILYHSSIDNDVLKQRLETFVVDYQYAEYHAHPKLAQVDTLLVEYLKLYNYYLDLLILLDVTGTYTLVNKSDIEGFYSVGNSLDILKMFRLIIPFINNEYIENSIYECVNVFEKSLNDNLIVAIYYQPLEESRKTYRPLGKINENALKRKVKNK